MLIPLLVFVSKADLRVDVGVQWACFHSVQVITFCTLNFYFLALPLGLHSTH